MVNETKKILIISRYFHVLGGGERYLFSIANALKEKYSIFMIINPNTFYQVNDRFGLNLNGVHTIPENVTKNNWKFILKEDFEVIFYMTDGSVFFSRAPKNFLIIQSPDHIPKNTILNKLKLKNWKIICYSKFMYEIIKERLHINSIILTPCIDIEAFNTSYKKRNSIITVGRFFTHLHSKKQQFMIEAFKKLNDTYTSSELIMAGGCQHDDLGYVDVLRKKIGRYPIRIVVNPGFHDLIKNYRQSKVYWHAAGFGEDINKFPERVEHFGITVLEALASGTVPLVYNAGGPKEIIENTNAGFIWKSEIELIDKTVKILSDDIQLNILSARAIKKANIYSCLNLYGKIQKIIETN